MRTVSQLRQAGFTLIEIMVIAPIVILAIGAFVTVIISMTGEVLASRGSNALTYDVQDAMNRIEQDVKLSTTFLAQNDLTLSNGQGYDNGTTKFTNADGATGGGTNGTALILKMLVTNGNPVSTTTGIVYLANQPNACASSEVQANTPMTLNVVYFVKNDPANNNIPTLWRRTIMPSNYTNGSDRCSTPWQQPSCLPGYNPAVLTFCKTNDVKLVSGVATSGFFVEYFSSAASTTPNTSASSAASITDRNLALASTPTVGISINASRSIAGRTIERSASLRATRLETNASTVASTIISTPATPVVTGKLLNGENANFTWPVSSGGNVTYNVDYNIDGGAWNTGVVGTSSLSYTKLALRGQTVNVRVRATNSAGTSSYATGSVTIPLWNSLVYQNNWTSYGSGYANGEFTKTSSGVVILKGLVMRTGAVVADETIATLPEGFRPATKMNFLVAVSGVDSATLYIMPNGDIKAGSNTTAAATALDRIAFLPATTQYTWNDLTSTFKAGWTNRGNVDDPNFSYAIDSMGHVHTRGHLNPGTVTSGTAWASPLPAEIQVTPKLIIAYRSGCNGHLALNIGPTIFESRGTCAGTLVSFESLYLPSTYTSWTPMTMQNSWVTFNATSNAVPEYTKTSDGIVTLKGLIKSGTTTSGTVVTTLPVGYRPKATLVFSSSCDDAICRFDINSSGQVLIRGGSASWSSLSGLNFLAEQ